MTRKIFSFAARPLVASLVLCGGALLGTLGVPAAANAATTYNPPIHMTKAGVEYMSGGIGHDEEALIETIEPRWPASFEFAVKDHQKADFAADVRVSVRNTETGATVLDNVDARGPFMVARLDAGRYEVAATLSGQTVKQQITVNGTGPAKAMFLFPTGTDMASNAVSSVPH